MRLAAFLSNAKCLKIINTHFLHVYLHHIHVSVLRVPYDLENFRIRTVSFDGMALRLAF